MAGILWVAAGGALGALMRFGVVSLVFRLLGPEFPWGTLTANLIGSLAIGVLWAIGERTPLSAGESLFLFVGVLGAFTTFSTFSIETVNLMRDGKLLAALGNVLISNVTCLAAAWIGLRLGGGMAS